MADRKTVIQVKFRLREALLHKIERAAKDNDRSVNEEIERRLEQSFERQAFLLDLKNTVQSTMAVMATGVAKTGEKK